MKITTGPKWWFPGTALSIYSGLQVHNKSTFPMSALKISRSGGGEVALRISFDVMTITKETFVLSV